MNSLVSKIFRSYQSLPIINSDNIVFTNGCFDILHPGHLNYLLEARKLGNMLVVGLNSDMSITKLKGKGRPINDFIYRSLMLAGYDFVDVVIEFDEETPLELIKSIKPHILVKGSDYNKQEVVGGDFVCENGGRIVLIDFVDGYSSSKVIQKIYSSFK